ncbi:MAG: hypothetical protein M3Y59_06315 [Myxococcota bacterium]|nr:hypothetical protein [Myxococcota bacterium]
MITEDQQVIERLDVTGSMTVRANQITIRLNRITNPCGGSTCSASAREWSCSDREG